MEKKELYSIGEVSKICNISKKALRFYDKINIISPDLVSEETNYRYYSRETLLFLPVIKYYKQMGFKLEEMKEFIEGETYELHEKGFRKKIDELRVLRDEINISYRSVCDWYDLILEAESVISNNVVQVSVKFIDSMSVLFMEQEFQHNYRESVINIEWTNYLESMGQAITGPVCFYFPDIREKLEGKNTKVVIFQRPATDVGHNPVMSIGGKMMISAYHIGPLDKLSETYDKIYKWVEENGYRCADGAIERCVTDYWTIGNEAEHVTEILIEIVK